LSDEPALNQRLLHPRHAHKREYWAQVERVPAPDGLRRLEKGLMLHGKATLPCTARILEPQPEFPPRDPPIRFRKTVPVCWIALELIEGKNRQVRRMTAAIGHPTLRLIRIGIGRFTLGALSAGTWKTLSLDERRLVLSTQETRPACPADNTRTFDYALHRSKAMPPIPTYLRAQADAVLLSVKLQPRASRTEISGPAGDDLRIKVTAPPVDHAANEALIEFLAARLHCAKNRVELLKGATARRKLIRLHGFTAGQILEALDPSS
jgi:23S rRNA pseudouridine2457 synthase